MFGDGMVNEKWIRELIKTGELWKFYKSREWRKLKASILKAAHYECAECKKHGKITRHDEGGKLISTVHHVCRVREHPELALSEWYKDYETGKLEKNLIPVCKACHNRLHPEKIKRDRTGFMNDERW